MTLTEVIAAGVVAMTVMAPINVFIAWLDKQRNNTDNRVRPASETDPLSPTTTAKKNWKQLSTASRAISALGDGSIDVDEDQASEISGSPRGSITSRKRLSKQTSTTTYQRTAKGKLKITKCDPNGRFLTVENTGEEKNEDIGKWTLKRIIEGQSAARSFTFPANFSLKPGTAVKVWARGHAEPNPPTDLVYTGHGTWGKANVNADTQLIDLKGTVMASLNQKTDTKREAITN